MKYALVLLTSLFCFSAVGCAQPSKVTGGTARHDTGGFTMEFYPPGGGKAVVTDNREVVATTQPSITSTGDVTKIRTSAAEEGDIGGISFSVENFKTNKTAWGLVGLLLLFAVGFYLMHNYIGVAVCLCCTVLAFLAPWILVWAVLGIAAWLIYANRDLLKQNIAGIKRGLSSIDPISAARVKLGLEAEQSPKTQRVVKDIKGGLPDTPTPIGAVPVVDPVVDVAPVVVAPPAEGL